MKITARLLSGEVCEVQFENGHFTSVVVKKDDLLDLPWIAPGLIDIQVNGFGGVDFNRALESEDAWRHATDQLYAHGCTGFLATLITNTPEGYDARLRELTGQIRREPRNCLGFHLEGPWLNPDPAYRGAHRADWMTRPDPAQLDRWRVAADGLLKLVTLAPAIPAPWARN